MRAEPLPAVPDPAELARRVDQVRERVRAAGGDPERIRLIAVTKGFGVEVVRAARAAGLVDLGESYAQELVAKATALAADESGEADPAPTGPGRVGAGAPNPRWHFIGRLQRNKVRSVAEWVALWHSVDRVDLGDEIARRAPGAEVLVQVNLSGQDTKGGCRPDSVEELVGELAERGLVVRGLMGVGTAGDADATRAGFASLVATADRLGLAERCIGMSDDLEWAVAAGSTMVRVGRALFGERPAR